MEDLNHVWHHIVHDLVLPSQLQNKIGTEKVITLQQGRSEALLIVIGQEEP